VALGPDGAGACVGATGAACAGLGVAGGGWGA